MQSFPRGTCAKVTEQLRLSLFVSDSYSWVTKHSLLHYSNFWFSWYYWLSSSYAGFTRPHSDDSLQPESPWGLQVGAGRAGRLTTLPRGHSSSGRLHWLPTLPSQGCMQESKGGSFRATGGPGCRTDMTSLLLHPTGQSKSWTSPASRSGDVDFIAQWEQLQRICGHI